ncbi:MAG: sugar phosphate nucleotidyltransferase [Aigarchaeota archaeon]|nr:sugar phosphate nucleotidyltransferase [Aigarchaeota archaeon]MDW8093217.1 sugar phosphate nucleotidyltransferase [Nitrososphaerota archaeon]
MKALILAAGIGKRLRPLSENVPKHLLPIAGEPVIKIVLDSLRQIGVVEVGIVVGYKPDLLISAVRDFARGIRVTYIDQGRPLGTGHALRVAMDFLRDSEKFIMIYGDVTMEPSVLEALIEEVHRRSADGGLVAVEVSDPRSYGVVIERDGYLEGFIEKPIDPPSNLINAGVYVLPRESLLISDEVGLSPRGEYELTDVITELARRGRKIVVLKSERDWWFDIGKPSDLLAANVSRLRRELRDGIKLSPLVSLGNSVTLTSTYLGEGSSVGDLSLIRSSSIMSRALIGPRSRIENCLILEGSRVGGGSALNYCIVAQGARVPEGTSLTGSPYDPAILS